MGRGKRVPGTGNSRCKTTEPPAREWVQVFKGQQRGQKLERRESVGREEAAGKGMGPDCAGPPGPR